MMESYTLKDIVTLEERETRRMFPSMAAMMNDAHRAHKCKWRWVLTREIAAMENNGGELLETASIPQNSGEGSPLQEPSPLEKFGASSSQERRLLRPAMCSPTRSGAIEPAPRDGSDIVNPKDRVQVPSGQSRGAPINSDFMDFVDKVMGRQE